MSLTNKEITKKIKLLVNLLELHGENPFKIRGYSGALQRLEGMSVQVSVCSEEQLVDIGFSKKMAAMLLEIVENGTHENLEALLSQTPEDVLKMLNISGIGPKKVRAIWQDMNIDTIDGLMEACQANRVSEMKGFGKKTEATILESLQYMKSNSGKIFYAHAENLFSQLAQKLDQINGILEINPTGSLRRRLEIIDLIEVALLIDQNRTTLFEEIGKIENLTVNPKESSPFYLCGSFHNEDHELPFKIHFSETHVEYLNTLFGTTGSQNHLLHSINDEHANLHQIVRNNKDIETEEELYHKANLPYIEPELREGIIEFDLAKKESMPDLLEVQDLKGILHNHSTYSDGANTLKEMADACRDNGFEYFGISDHSQTAFYANGLKEEDVFKQHKEIDQLNAEYGDSFKIFKGIESDILNDGALDYPDEVLSSFDYIVASIHSNLGMDEKKATARLIKAIENPYTTILGHMTGRILLRREGYPVDHQKVIDACAANGVIIEINASPYRLDIDWRWVHKALEKDVMLSINPDAHEIKGLWDIKYGTLIGRKGGLTKDMTFNAMSKKEMEIYFQSRKK
ncbi:DNA polymerase/3'-5' exonuclease PolX [Aureibacter tunicatorum]|uniref:DNA polymerase (Family 10) n=1 Tax=Aureibacter tunicatorum TaxID=866807 RepID=A0AAE4BRB1_9BACT|nr:helix-hairpin-helix domain-containing protein [Aureibacter tunicatorum]MDR6240024.1 DNA polymerase (family 10) [Aureibacter tunicatorum]BDD04496.1 DNA polymerase/3'-5' exonuclease PolX [Aureibacter tunicatorum]